MKQIIRHIFGDGRETISDNENTVIVLNKMKPIAFLEDSVNEELFDKMGHGAVKLRDTERLKEREVKEKEKLEKDKRK